MEKNHNVPTQQNPSPKLISTTLPMGPPAPAVEAPCFCCGKQTTDGFGIVAVCKECQINGPPKPALPPASESECEQEESMPTQEIRLAELLEAVDRVLRIYRSEALTGHQGQREALLALRHIREEFEA